MWSVRDMFYGQSEPVWILKPEKEDNKKAEGKPSGGGGGESARKEKEKAQEYSVLSSIPYYPYYYPDYVPSPSPSPSPAKKPESNKATEQKEQKEQKKDTRVVMKVPICCGECEELVESALYSMKGVKSVDCNSYREKVTVVATTAAPADILSETRRVFKKSRLWADDD